MLSIRHVTVNYGGVPAVRDVSFDVADGEILGIIGPNGAGKTSLFDALSGLTATAADSRILVDEVDISRLMPERRCRAGIARTFQIPRLFPTLTVRENLEVVGDAEQIDRYLELCGIADRADELPGNLPLPMQKRCEIARALVSGGRVLLLDEVAAGLPVSEHAAFVELLRTLGAAHNRTILMIEHVLPLVETLTERVIVLDAGAIIAEGTLAELRRDPTVVAAYLGRPEETA